MKKVPIVLSGDYGYIDQITATIKSIVYHNRDLKIYVINPDIPQEWFNNVRHYLTILGCQLVDLKIKPDTFIHETAPHSHISLAAYGRLLIPKLVAEDKVLYLDCDTIVDGPLDELFRLQLGNHPLAAAKDVFPVNIFNSGVLLINNQQLKQDPEIVDKFLKAGQDPNIPDADQSVLNRFYGDTYLHLPIKFNYVIGYDSNVFYIPQNSPDYFNILSKCNDPVIIHFASDDKPWHLYSAGRMREKWWQYADLSWSEIITHQSLPLTLHLTRHHVLTFTASDQLIHLENLLQTLPDTEFNVAAWTNVSFNLQRLMTYPNFRLFPSVAGPLLDQIVQKCDAYLDINVGPKETQFIQKFTELKRPILTFTSVSARQPNETEFADEEWQQMADYIQTL